MPDITMCRDDTCPLKESCGRNPASGAKPDERQAYFASKPLWSRRTVAGETAVVCPYFWNTFKERRCG